MDRISRCSRDKRRCCLNYLELPWLRLAIKLAATDDIVLFLILLSGEESGEKVVDAVDCFFSWIKEAFFLAKSSCFGDAMGFSPKKGYYNRGYTIYRDLTYRHCYS